MGTVALMKILGSFATLEGVGFITRWRHQQRFYTYLRLGDQADPRLLEQKFPAMLSKCAGEQLSDTGVSLKLSLQPFASIHLHSHLDSVISPNSNISYVYLFTIVAVFILLIACINFMNLTTPRAATRAKEVGIRKVVGAYRMQVIAQLLCESMLLSTISVILAYILVTAGLPIFSALAGKMLSLTPQYHFQQFTFRIDLSPMIFLMAGILAVLVALLTVSYQAIKAAMTNPVETLRYE